MTEEVVKAEELENTAIEDLRRQVKALIVAKGFTMEKLAEGLNAKYYTKESKANLSNKLKRGTLRHIEMIRILNILGYELDIKSKQQ